MRREVTVCDSCREVIEAGWDHYQVPAGQILVEAGQKAKFLRVRLQSGRYTDAPGDRVEDTLMLDLCRSCARRLVEALERIAAMQGR